jgi:hypothetical protein
LAAEPHDAGRSGDGHGRVAVLERSADRFERSVDVHSARSDYRSALVEARKADVAPEQNLLAEGEIAPVRLEREARELQKRAEQEGGAAGGAGASPESLGVSQATLDSIASCESGGDPAAVSSDGTYRGKYQFDTGTWASVGGSGDPAAAPESEQDMRAAMLYSRAGSSPWPICG